MRFLKLLKDDELDNYLVFRANTNKLRTVFEYASAKGIVSDYAKGLHGINTTPVLKEDKRKITNDERFLDHNKIFINGKELTDNLWLRPKSKTIFLYCIYKSSINDDITKERIIDDILYKAKDVNYDAIVDV